MEIDPAFVDELRRLAATGTTPYDIATVVWEGPAQQRAVPWITIMMRAFAIPMGTLIGVSPERAEMDAELAPWIHPPSVAAP